MKHIFRTFISLIAMLALASQAAGIECTPVAPKDVDGKINFAHEGPSLATSFFEANGCSWNGAEGLNGSDGIVLDVSEVGGTTGAVTATLPNGTSLQHTNLVAHFLDDTCAAIGGSNFDFGTSGVDNPESETLSIPVGAKWLVVAESANATNDISINLHSNGKDCPTATPTKKKKKKR
jgi:hypothetical protein